MKLSPVVISAFLALSALSSAKASITLFSAWDLNEGSGSTTTQYQLPSGGLWNQVTNPEALLPATVSANFSTASGLAWGSASLAPNSTGSLQFAGSNAVNTLNTNVSGTGLAGTGAKTFVAWINPTAVNAAILSYSPNSANVNGADLRLLINSSGKLRAEVTGGFFEYAAGSSLVNNGWVMVAAVFNGNTNTSSLYISSIGMLDSSMLSVSARAINTGGSASNFIIGGDHARSYSGGIDMVAVYTGAATESELDAIFANGVAVIPEPSSFSLIAGGLGLGLVLIRRRKYLGENRHQRVL